MRIRALVLLAAAFMLAFLMTSCGEEAAFSDEAYSVQPTVNKTDEEMPKNRTVRLAVNENIGSSDLILQLKKEFEADTAYTLEISSNTNATAVSVAQAGKADALWIIDGTAAKQFVSAGYGSESEIIMYDNYILAGPATDTAGVRACAGMTEAFAAIREEGTAGFISRGDESDICSAEKTALSNAGFVVGSGSKWYFSTGLGMNAALLRASERGAYTLCTKEAFLRLSEELSIEMLLECADMKNAYVLINVDSEMIENINADGAAEFRQWLSSEKAASIIDSFGINIYGDTVFYR